MYTGKKVFNTLYSVFMVAISAYYAFTGTGIIHTIVSLVGCVFYIVWFCFWLFTRKH